MPYEKFNKKRRQWEDSGVLELIKLWKCCAYELRTIKRNGHLYVAMAKELTTRGIPVTALEVHFKVNNLTQRYRQELKAFTSAGILSTWKFYHQVEDVFKSLEGVSGFKEKRMSTANASNASTLPSTSESSVWKNPMSQQEFSNNSEGFYKTEYGMHRHFMDHSQAPPNPGADVNFMTSSAAAVAVAAAASARLAENSMEQMNAAASGGAGSGGTGSTNGGVVPNYNKIKKPNEDYDKFVDIVKNIVDNHKRTPERLDTFSEFIKTYMRQWPERLQDEAINHISNYIHVKHTEHTKCYQDNVNNRQ